MAAESVRGPVSQQRSHTQQALAALSRGRSTVSSDTIFRTVTLIFAGAILALLVAIFIVLFIDARVAIGRYGLSLLTGRVWNPQRAIFGILPYIFGTLYTSLIGLLIATPVAVGAALFIVEYAPPWLRNPVGFVVELL